MKTTIPLRTGFKVGAVTLLFCCLSLTRTSAAPEDWVLVMGDEFDGPTINSQNWTFDLGGGGWGNGELEYYTSRPENARIENGNLVIEARAERYRGRNYTSARLKSQGLKTFKYGRIEASIKIPYGQGIWPAFWMLGDDISTVSWPDCGEIDIMENIGREPLTIHGTVHGPGYSGADGFSSALDASTPWSNDYHVYAIEWTPNRIDWFVDDFLYSSVTPDDVYPYVWVFDHPFFIILNVAVGGYWPGDPDATTVFQQQMLVDYVRVYQPASEPPPVGSNTMFVSSIEMAPNTTGPFWQAKATVTITDGSAPVSGATVQGTWSGLVDGGNTSFVTDANGIAGPFYSHKSKTSGSITFTVSNVSKADFTYYPASNVVTSATLSY